MTYLIDVLENIDKRIDKKCNNPDIIDSLKQERQYFTKELIKEELKEDEMGSYRGVFTRSFNGSYFYDVDE